MKCLFFGSSGYLGRHMVRALQINGNEVIIPKKENGDRLDLLLEEPLSKIDWNVDTVFMYAGITGTGVSFDEHKKFILNNELSLLNVLNAIRQSPFRPRVIFPSTRLVYRGSDKPLDEDSYINAKTLYAVNKIACENYLEAYANAFDIPYTVLRICIPYGNSIDRQYSFGTIGSFIHQASTTGRICLYGNGVARRSFTHIEDLSRISILAAKHPQTINHIFNMPGEDLSLNDAASMIASSSGAVVEGVDWPAWDYRIESGSTVFDASNLLDLLETKIIYNFSDWTKSISNSKN